MDLSKHHEAIGELFREQLGADPVSFTLTEAQVAQYHEEGFLGGIPILTDAQCDALCDALADLVKPDHVGKELWYEYNSNESVTPDTVLFHALGAWRVREGMHDILWNPAYTVPASQLLGGSVRMWHDQLFSKPAKHGGVVAWHQDYSYWTRTKPLNHLTCWIGLDEATEENGCVQYIPGSHRWPLLPITGLAGDMEAILTVLDEEQKAAFTPVPMELKRGHAVFHHPLMVHGSYENRSDRSRRAVVLNAVRDGVCSDTDDALLAGVPPVPKGEALGGQFFPLLRDVGE